MNIQIVDASNVNVLFGCIKMEQDDMQIVVKHEPQIDEMTLVDSRNNSFDNLPTSLDTSKFNELFSSTDLTNIGIGYTMNISTNASLSGSYNSNFKGFSIDDSNIQRNVEYMSTFSDSPHIIEITNGDLVSEIGINNFMFELQDGDEKLDSMYYNKNGFFKTYATHREERSILLSKSSDNIPSLRITYPGEEGYELANVLSSEKMATYDVNYEVQVIVPSTDLNSGYLTDVMVGKSGKALAVIANNDVSFNSSKVLFTATESINNNNDSLNLFQLRQEYLMTEETGSKLYYINDKGINTPYVDSLNQKPCISAVVSNVNLRQLLSQNVRVKLDPKTIKDITNWPTISTEPKWVYTNGNVLQSQKNVREEFMKDDLYTINDNKLQFNYNLIINANTKAKNINSLNFNVYEGYDFVDPGFNTITGGLTHDENDMTQNMISNTSGNFLVPKSFVMNLPSNYDLYVMVIKQRLKFNIRTKFGPYNNLSVETQEFDSLTLKPYLYDNSLNKTVPDGLLSRLNIIVNDNSFFINDTSLTYGITIGYSGNKCLRLISNNIGTLTCDEVKNMLAKSTVSISSILLMSYKDLYGFKGYIQSSPNGLNWNNISLKDEESYVNVDCIFDYASDFKTVGTVPLSLNFMCDIPANSVIPKDYNLSTSHYVDLSNKKGTSIFKIKGKSYIKDQLDGFTSLWNPQDNTNSFFPNSNGTDILNLSTSVKKITTDNPERQNQIKVDIIRTTDGQNTILYTFETDVDIASNFNIIYNPTPSLRITENIGGTTNTYYVSEQTQGENEFRYIKVSPGVEVRLKNNKLLNVGEIAKFALLSDEIECKPYLGYLGPYSTRSSITPANGLNIGDDKCRCVKLTKYRGVISTEEIQLSRTPTKISFSIIKDSITCSNDLGELYFGSSSVVNELGDLKTGNLGLVVNGNLSMFETNTNMKQMIEVIQGKYNLTIVNPHNVSMNENVVITTNMVDIKLFETLKIRASRVKIYKNESYSISCVIPNLKVYYKQMDAVGIEASSQVYGNPQVYDTQVYDYSDEELRAGVIINNSQLYLKRTSLNVTKFTEYYSLVKPQFQIEAISINDVSDSPYDATNISRKVCYEDMNHIINSYSPFTSISGLNDITLVQLEIDNYTDLRLHTDEEYDYFKILSNTIEMQMNVGTEINDKYPIYTGEVHKMNLANANNFNSSYDSLTGISDFKYRQPMDKMVSTDIANKMTDGNIIVGGIHIFGTDSGQINMCAGDSLKFKLYGYRIDNDIVNNVMKVVFCKYETNYGFDYFNKILDPLQVTKNIKFYATDKYECSVLVQPKTILDEKPYNLANIISNAKLDESWTWTKVNEWLSVDDIIRYKTLLLETPDLMAYKSLDGSSSMKVTYSGCLLVPVIRTYECNFGDLVSPFSDTSCNEMFAYNILSLNTP